MSGMLALIGGAPFAAASQFHPTILQGSQRPEVLVIPTAAAYEHPDEKVAEAQVCLESFGATVASLPVLTRADALDEDNADRVRQAAVVYLIGSSAQHAKSVFMHSPVFAALVDAWRDGTTIVGSDAGAQILGDPMVDSRGGAFTIGLGLIRRLAVIPQANSWSVEARHRIKELTAPDLAVVAIDESTVAIRDLQGHWRAEGNGDVGVHVGETPVALVDFVC